MSFYYSKCRYTESASCWTPNGAGHCVHGRCVATEDGSTFSCQCDPGYSGEFCTDSKSLCSFLFIYLFRFSTFTLAFMEHQLITRLAIFVLIDVNDCADNPCRNGATCIDGIDSFHCVCPKGYEGQTCDQSQFSFPFFFLYFENF